MYKVKYLKGGWPYGEPTDFEIIPGQTYIVMIACDGYDPYWSGYPVDCTITAPDSLEEWDACTSGGIYMAVTHIEPVQLDGEEDV